MPAIRKLPVAYNPKKPVSGRGEFLLPFLSGTGDSGFVGIRSGRRHEFGALSFVGIDVTPEMLLERFCERQPSPADRNKALQRLSAYVDSLHAFKIGNVLAVSYTPNSLPVLRLESEFTRFPARAPLP